MTDELPGRKITIPIPPEADRAFGYAGDARYLGISWTCAGDEVWLEDGRTGCTGAGHAFLIYKRHPAVAPLLAGADLGSTDQDGSEVLLIDREGSRASIATKAEARAFLRDQWPPKPPLSPEQVEAVQREMERLLSEWQPEPMDSQAIVRAMAEQRGRVNRLIAWLDLAPKPPEQRGRP